MTSIATEQRWQPASATWTTPTDLPLPEADYQHPMLDACPIHEPPNTIQPLTVIGRRKGDEQQTC
jgi:hypothetical protein